MSTKSDLVRAKLAKKPNPTTEEIKAWAEEIKCSPSLVYKWLRRIPEDQRKAVEAAEPVVSVGEEAEEAEEEAPTEEFEVPSEFEGKEEAEVTEEAPTEEITIEEEAEEAEEQRQLREITKRAIKRFFGIALEEGLGLGKDLGLTDQEAEDTEVLVMLMLAKYVAIEVKENLLEIASGLHFGSIGLKILVAWIKKKRAEGKEKERKKESVPTPEETEEKPAEKPPETEAKEERDKDGLTSTEKKLVKKWTGGE